MKSFSEKESSCEMTFQHLQPCWHSFSCGKDTPILFVTDNDMAFVMNVISQSSLLFGDKVNIIAFTVMNNHLHFIFSGTHGDIDVMLYFITRRLKRAFPSYKTLAFSHKSIDDLASMRSHIVYVHRNGYVADCNYTPFSYPWGTGAYYYVPLRSGIPFRAVSSIDNRRMFRSRDVRLPDDWQVVDSGVSRFDWHASPYNLINHTSHIAPSSFCSVKQGMAMFRDAHQYFSMVGKNVEAYSGIAVELDDGEFLTDQELFAQVLNKVRDQYHVATMRELTKAQRLDLARSLRYDYRSSNGQIRRVLGLTQYEVYSLFPMGK